MLIDYMIDYMNNVTAAICCNFFMYCIVLLSHFSNHICLK